MRAFLLVALFASSAAPLLGACTQDENSSNPERDTHMGASRMAALAPPLPEVAAPAKPAPATPPSASAAASAPAPAASAPAPAAAASSAPPAAHAAKPH